jgi:hypothetical protein
MAALDAVEHASIMFCFTGKCKPKLSIIDKFSPDPRANSSDGANNGVMTTLLIQKDSVRNQVRPANNAIHRTFAPTMGPARHGSTA